MANKEFRSGRTHRFKATFKTHDSISALESLDFFVDLLVTTGMFEKWIFLSVVGGGDPRVSRAIQRALQGYLATKIDSHFS